MIAQLLLSFREGFEALLLITILVTFLRRVGRGEDVRYAYLGGVSAVLVGFIIAIAVIIFYGGLSESYKQIFEGMTAFIAVAVLTYMIIWMAGKDIRREVEMRAMGKYSVGIAIVSFIFVVREAFETVLFLTPFAFQNIIETALGTVIGITFALLLAYTIFKAGYRMSLRKFFIITGLLLIFIASGLAGYGTHELIEYMESVGIENPLFETAYNLNIPENSLFHHKGVAGSILSVMFGYTTKAEWLRVFIQIGYLVIMIPAIIRYRK